MTILRTAIFGLGLALAACSPRAAPAPAGARPEALETEPAPEVEGDPVAALAGEITLNYKDEKPQYAISSEIDPEIAAFDPALAALLWKSSRESIMAFSEQALQDEKVAAEEAAAEGGESWFRGYSLDMSHVVTAVTDDIISIERVNSYYTGGAHPNSDMSGSIFSRTSPAPLEIDTIVADIPAFREAIIRGLIAEKMTRGFEPGARAFVEGEVRDLITGAASDDPAAMVSNIVLEASDEPGKFGGITVLYSPYDAGAYAEGAYAITVPNAALQPMLAPDWRDKFGGKPVPRPDAAR